MVKRPRKQARVHIKLRVLYKERFDIVLNKYSMMQKPNLHAEQINDPLHPHQPFP